MEGLKPLNAPWLARSCAVPLARAGGNLYIREDASAIGARFERPATRSGHRGDSHPRDPGTPGDLTPASLALLVAPARSGQRIATSPTPTTCPSRPTWSRPTIGAMSSAHANVPLRDAPGIGVDIDEDALRRYAVKDVPIFE